MSLRWSGLRLASALSDAAAQTGARLRRDPRLGNLAIDARAGVRPLRAVLDGLFPGVAWTVDDGVILIWGIRGRPDAWLDVLPAAAARPQPRQQPRPTAEPPMGADGF